MSAPHDLFQQARQFHAHCAWDQSVPVFILIGWGRGEVFLAWLEALQAWRKATASSAPAHCLILEPEAVDSQRLQRDLSWVDGFSECDLLAAHRDALHAGCPSSAPGLHFQRLDALNLQLHWLTAPVLLGLRAFVAQAQAVWVSPGHLTQAAQIHALSRLMTPGGHLLTPTLPEALSPILGHAGFEATDLPLRGEGFAGKCHFKRRVAQLRPRTQDQAPILVDDQPSEKLQRVAVVGGGIAGSSVALALCDAGLNVTLFEAESACAQGASGNRVGAFHPHITRDDTPLSQLTRLGCEHTVLALERLSRAGFLERGRDWDLPGHLQTVSDPECARMQETLLRLAAEPDWVQWRARGEAFADAPPGLWFPKGGWVSPARWVQANLQACGPRLELRTREQLTALPHGFDAVVVAAAQHSLDLASVPGYSANQVKGQVSVYERARALPCVLSGQSYAIDAQQDWVLLGATYERPVVDLTPTDRADSDNLSRFQAAYPGWPVGRLLDRRCAIRSVWPDRLAAVGRVGDRTDVWLCTGFASRGLTWAALAAWQVANLMGQYGPHAPRFKLLDKFAPNRYRRDGTR